MNHQVEALLAALDDALIDLHAAAATDIPPADLVALLHDGEEALTLLERHGERLELAAHERMKGNRVPRSGPDLPRGRADAGEDPED